MRKQQKKLLDAYYTDQSVAKNLINSFNKHARLSSFDIIVDPAAGSGNFMLQIPKINNQIIIGLDINPKHKSVAKQNFLTWKFPKNKFPHSNKILCISNPPYGRQSKIAKQFVMKCSDFADHIAFILPISYKAIPPNFKLQWVIPLPDNIFVDPDGVPFPQSLKTGFFYFKKDITYTLHTPKLLHPNGLWEFRSKTDPYERDISHFRIVRASGTPGRAIHKNTSNFAVYGTYNDHYIQLCNKLKKHSLDIVNQINDYQKKNKWTFNNTTTFKSIDQQQVIKLLNKLTSAYVD